MRTHVEFKSDKFPPYEGEEEEINPDLWGKRLAEFLSKQLSAHGFQPQEYVTEDWGCMIPLHHDAFRMWIGCGHYQEYPDGYLVFIVPSKPTVRKLFKKIDTRADVEKLAATLDTILHSDADIRDIQWWDGQNP